MPSYTRTELRILDLLCDGLPHQRGELCTTIDTLATPTTLQRHISNIRSKLRPTGHDIVCEIYNAKICYRHVILLASAYE